MNTVNPLQELFQIGIAMRETVRSIEVYYPDLIKYNAIKRLVLLSNKWDNTFTEALKTTMDEVNHAIS